MPELRRIVFATDFSAAAEQALDHALWLARHQGAELHVLNAVVLRGESGDRRFDPPEELLEELEKAARSELAARQPPEARPAPAVLEVVRRGFYAGDVIVDYAEEVGADLVVMGTHGRRGPGRVLLGSTAADVVRHAPCPVLTLREQATPRRPGPWRRLLVPVDFSEPSKRALELAREVAASHGSTIELLHVVERRALPEFYAPPAPHGEQLEELRRRCEQELAALMGDSELPWQARVAHGRPGAEVVRAAADADVVVIATRGSSGLQRLVFGSTAEEVLRGAPCPVLTIRGGRPEGRKGA